MVRTGLRNLMSEDPVCRFCGGHLQNMQASEECCHIKSICPRDQVHAHHTTQPHVCTFVLLSKFLQPSRLAMQVLPDVGQHQGQDQLVGVHPLTCLMIEPFPHTAAVWQALSQQRPTNKMYMLDFCVANTFVKIYCISE